MRYRRLVLAALVVAAATPAVAGCGGGGGGETTGKATAPQVKLVQHGVMTIASDISYLLFEFHKGKTLTGFDVALMDDIAKKVGLRPKWVNTDFDTIFTALATGRFDVVTATTGAFWAEEKAKPFGVKLVSFSKAPDMYAALEAGNVDAVINDLPVSQDAVKTKHDLKVIAPIDTGEQYAFAVAKDNKALLDATNRALDGLVKDGTYAKVFEQYFPGQKPPAYASA